MRASAASTVHAAGAVLASGRRLSRWLPTAGSVVGAHAAIFAGAQVSLATERYLVAEFGTVERATIGLYVLAWFIIDKLAATWGVDVDEAAQRLSLSLEGF